MMDYSLKEVDFNTVAKSSTVEIEMRETSMKDPADKVNEKQGTQVTRNELETYLNEIRVAQVTRNEFETYLRDMKDAHVTRNEFETFKASMRSVADNLSERMGMLIQEVKRSNSLQQSRQRHGSQDSATAEMGIDGPALREERIEMEGIQQGDEGTRHIQIFGKMKNFLSVICTLKHN